MKATLLCFKCGSEIESTFEIVIRHGRVGGLWSLAKKARLTDDYELFCGYCNQEGDAE